MNVAGDGVNRDDYFQGVMRSRCGVRSPARSRESGTQFFGSGFPLAWE